MKKNKTIALFAFLIIFIITNCNKEKLSDLYEIKDMIDKSIIVNRVNSYVVKNKTMIINGGEPPKFYKKFGLDITSEYEKDIILIDFKLTDTLALKIKHNYLLRSAQIHATKKIYNEGDTLKVRLSKNNHIVIY